MVPFQYARLIEIGGRGTANVVHRPHAPEVPLDSFGAPEEDGVARVIGVLRDQGVAAGVREAKRLGQPWLDAVRAYVDARAWTEERLAGEVARIRAAVTRGARSQELTLNFLERRLQEVRDARSKASTPPQAVADLPEVPRNGPPEWLPYAGLAIAALGLALSLRRS
jgi:hypothetical protein